MKFCVQSAGLFDDPQELNYSALKFRQDIFKTQIRNNSVITVNGMTMRALIIHIL